MEKKYIAILLISGFFTVGLFIFGIIGYTTYDNIDVSDTYEYEVSGSEIENIKLDTDISDITIRYNESIMDSNTTMIIKSKIHIEGMFIKGRKFSNFFEPVNIINTSILGINIRKKSLSEFNFINWFLGINVDLEITLRTDMKYNMSAVVGEGNIYFEGRGKPSVDNIKLKTSNGDISLDAQHTNFTKSIHLETRLGDINAKFNNSDLNGNLTIIGDSSDISLDTYNFSYNKDSNWDLTTHMGDIILNIHQKKNMNANVRIDAFISDIGTIICNYHDSLASIGARIVGSAGEGGVSLIGDLTGFTAFSENSIKSEDYNSALNKYIINLNAIVGAIEISAESV